MTTVYSLMKIEEGRVIRIAQEEEDVSIPRDIVCICDYASFNGILTTLNLEGTQIKIIGKYAFSHCYHLEVLMFSSCLEEICEGSFYLCLNLKHITFEGDSKLLKIGPKAFYECEKLESFDFPPSIESIGMNSFEKCSKLDFLDLRATKVQNLGKNIFGFDENKTIHLPATISSQSIKNNIYCKLDLDSSNKSFINDECGYIVCNRTIYHGEKEKKRILIRHGIERIYKHCFNKCELARLNIPASVIEIGKNAFFKCDNLKHVTFSKNSRLVEIKACAFFGCDSLKKIRIPKSLKILRVDSFRCISIEKVVFPIDSNLERFENSFERSKIRHLSLPPSVKEIDTIYGMNNLESIRISNDFYQSNEEGTAIFSKDGTELIYVIEQHGYFEIPDGVRVIKKRSISSSNIDRLKIPSSVEIIEDNAINSCSMERLEFADGSRLKYIGFSMLPTFEKLVINSVNFVTMENGVVMSLKPRGIVFVPRDLTEFEIDPDVEVIYSSAFKYSQIRSIRIPKSVKRVYEGAFSDKIESITFEEGTELELAGIFAFSFTRTKSIKLPLIKGELRFMSFSGFEVIELPPNICPKSIDHMAFSNYGLHYRIICPFSSVQALACFEKDANRKIEIIEDK